MDMVKKNREVTNENFGPLKLMFLNWSRSRERKHSATRGLHHHG